MAALLGRPAQWDKREDRPSKWKGRDYLEVPLPEDLSEASDTTETRLTQFVKGMLRLHGVPVTDDFSRNLRNLKAALKYRPAKHPYYTEERPKEPLFAEAKLRELLVLLRRFPEEDEMIHEITGLEEVLRQVFEKLDELEARQKGNTNP